jgi:hypothetical protein
MTFFNSSCLTGYNLFNAKATATNFDELGYDESAEFWHSVAGILEAILDEAEIWA